MPRQVGVQGVLVIPWMVHEGFFFLSFTALFKLMSPCRRLFFRNDERDGGRISVETALFMLNPLSSWAVMFFLSLWWEAQKKGFTDQHTTDGREWRVKNCTWKCVDSPWKHNTLGQWMRKGFQDLVWSRIPWALSSPVILSGFGIFH